MITAGSGARWIAFDACVSSASTSPPGSKGSMQAAQLGADLGVAVAHRALVDAQRRERHRAVHVDRELWVASGRGELTQVQQQHFRAVDCERRDQDGAAALGGTRDRVGHARERAGLVVTAAAVGGLDQQGAARGRRFGGQQHRVVGAPQVARRDERVVLAPVHHDAQPGPPEDVPGAMERHGDAGSDLERGARRDRTQAPQRRDGVGFGKERQGRLVFGEALAIRVARVLFLDAPGVGQQDPAEGRGALGAECGARESLPDQRGQVSRVVEMGVRQHHGIEAARLDGERLPVAQPQLLQALEETAVDQHARARRLDQEAASGDGSDRAEEAQRGSARRHRVALEHVGARRETGMPECGPARLVGAPA